ncbi:MAG: efflux RND transporter periplasmic adaptor subunit [Bryobacteraceae bacterium]
MRRPLLGVCVVLAGGLWMSGCAPVPTAELHSEPEAPTVAAVPVAREDLGREVTINGEFRPFQEVELHAKVAGYLKSISVDVGDHVRAGQVIAILEIPEMVDEAAQAVAAKRRAEAEVVRAKTDLVRADTSHRNAHLNLGRLEQVAKSRPNLIAQQELDDVRTKDELAEGQIETAKAAVAAAEQQVLASKASEERVTTMNSYSRIVAPFAGVVTKRYVDIGAMIQQGTSSSSQASPVVRISDISRLRMVLAVPESAVPSIKVGGKLKIRVDAVNRTFDGRVSRFADRLQDSTRTMETQIDVNNPNGDLKPGMFGTAILSLDRRDKTLAVPVQAVFLEKGVSHVYMVDQQKKVEDREVTIGLETPEKVEILKGLAEGDLVVTGGRSQVRLGQIVKLNLGGR